MSGVPYRRRLLFADGARSLYPDEIPRSLFLGTTIESGSDFVLADDDRAAHVYICGVTGSGKSRFLENMLVQDIICQRPLCLIDPTGALYRKMLEFLASCIEIAERKGHDPDQLLRSYLFLDLDSESNPLRINPLEPQIDETSEEQVDDFLKVAERLFGSIDEMRRIRNTLRSALWVIAELNRLPPEQRPEITSQVYPLNLRFAPEFLTMDDAERARLVGAIPDSVENSYVRTFWMRFFADYTPAQRQERVESTWNILQYFLGDSLVSRFFDVSESTLHIGGLMGHRQSLFCSLPLGRNLKGCQLVGTFLATKFQRAAFRRPPEERYPYYLYIDEFHEFADIEFAKAAATLRQYQLRMVNAHQSRSQPPFHTAEGRSILETITANAQVKILFRLSREDAETMTRELFELSQCRPNFAYSETSRSTGTSVSSTRTVSFQQSRLSGTNWARADSVAIAESDTYGIAKTEGVSLGKTLTEGFGESVTEGISETITRTESETLTELRSKAHGISLLIGSNWSHMVNHNTGFSFTQTQNESLTVQRGLSTTRTTTDQHGQIETRGRDYRVTDAAGDSLVRTQGQAAYHQTASPAGGREGRSDSSSSSLGQMRQRSQAHGDSYSRAVQRMRSVAQAIGRSESLTATLGQGESEATSAGHTVGDSAGGLRHRGITETDTVSQARAKLRGVSHATGRSLSIGRTHEVSLAESFQQVEQFSRSLSTALTETVSRTDTLGRTEQRGVSSGISEATATQISETETVTEKIVYFSLEGEREITINNLQRLPARHCVVAKTALAAVEIRTYFIPDGYYPYWHRSLPAEILRKQHERLLPDGEEAGVSVEDDSALPEVAELENSPWEF